MTTYREILKAIDHTLKLHRRAVKLDEWVRKDFERHGWYDEEIAEVVYDREQNLWSALETLYGRLPVEATE